MALSLYKISQTTYEDPKKRRLKHLEVIFNEGIDSYKILGKYEIKKNAMLNIYI